MSIVFVASGILACHSVNYANNNSNVLVITDIHLDPFNSCGTTVTESSQSCVASLIAESNPALWSFQTTAPNAFGDETNNSFFESALTGVSSVVAKQNITKIFVTGDLLSHDFPKQFESYVPSGNQSQQTQLALNTMNYVLYKIQQTAPKAKLYYIMGNNDTDQSDYSYPTESFMQQASVLFAPYMANSENFTATFANGGYSLMPLNDNVDVIGLNFNPLTVENASNPEDAQVAESQLTWLISTLNSERAKGKHVIILQHEPFGVNVYNIIESTTPIYNLQTPLQESYLTVYQQNSDIINNYYFGHYHMETMETASNILGIGTLGFSVDFYNNPGFKVLQLNNIGQLQDFTAYYSDYHKHGFNWRTLYQLNLAYNITPNNYIDFFQHQLQPTNNKAWLEYVKYYSGDNLLAPPDQMPIILPENWAIYYCSVNYMSESSFNSCLGQY